MEETSSASNVPTVLPAAAVSLQANRPLLLKWGYYLDEQLKALRPFAPNFGVAPAGIELIGWLTAQSESYATTVTRIIRHFIKSNVWPLTLSPEQAFYISARLGAGRIWVATLVDETPEVAAELSAPMPNLHDRSATLEWLLITAWRDPLADMVLRAAAKAPSLGPPRQ
jgi:hypothetical protein